MKHENIFKNSALCTVCSVYAQSHMYCRNPPRQIQLCVFIKQPITTVYHHYHSCQYKPSPPYLQPVLSNHHFILQPSPPSLQPDLSNHHFILQPSPPSLQPDLSNHHFILQPSPSRFYKLLHHYAIAHLFSGITTITPLITIPAILYHHFYHCYYLPQLT